MNQIQTKILQSKRDSVWSDEGSRASLKQEPWYKAHSLRTMRQKQIADPELYTTCLTHEFDIFKFAEEIGRP